MKIAILLAALLLPLSAWATVPDVPYTISYVCSGTTGPFPFAYPISDPTSLVVTQNGTVIPSVYYTTIPVNNNYDNGGSVTLVNACASGQTLVIARDTEQTQTLQFFDNQPTPFTNFERGLDKLTEIVQEITGTVNSIISGGGGGGGSTLPNCTVNNFPEYLASGNVVSCAPNLTETGGNTLNYIGSGGGVFTYLTTNGAGGGYVSMTEGTAPSCGTGIDVIWADSTAHALKACNNNGAAFVISSGSGTVTSSGSPVAGNIAKFTTATNIAPAAYTDITLLWASGSCSGYLKSDGTCSTPGGTTVNNIANVSHKWLNSFTAPNFTQTQPACADLSDSTFFCNLANLSGDGTTSGSGVFTLATVNSNVGSYTNANITVNAKGLVTAAANGSGGSGTVTTTGSPASGNLSKFSGATSITNGDLSGDVTTSGTLAATVVKVNGGSIPASAAQLASNGSNQIIAATYVWGFVFPGAPASSAYALRGATATCTIPANFTTPTTTASCGTNPTSNTVFTLKDGATTYGTVTLSSSCTATLATQSGTSKSVTVDDRLQFIAPASPDATAADIIIQLRCQ